MAQGEAARDAELPVLLATPDAASRFEINADVSVLATAAQPLELGLGFSTGGFLPELLEFHLIRAGRWPPNRRARLKLPAVEDDLSLVPRVNANCLVHTGRTNTAGFRHCFSQYCHCSSPSGRYVLSHQHPRTMAQLGGQPVTAWINRPSGGATQLQSEGCKPGRWHVGKGVSLRRLGSFVPPGNSSPVAGSV